MKKKTNIFYCTGYCLPESSPSIKFDKYIKLTIQQQNFIKNK